MSSICLYFHVHQPYRIKRYRIFDIGQSQEYFNSRDQSNLDNKKIFLKVAQKCYLPTNALLLELLEKYKEFKISFSITGLIFEQMEEFAPQVLTSFQKLVETGKVEIVGETYYHSLSFLYSKAEFESQVKLHEKKIVNLFGKAAKPKVFRNTELIYNNEVALAVASMGYKAILAEGADHILGWRSPNFVYSAKGIPKMKLLLKNYKLSDDIAFRFSSKDWSEYPLAAPKFASWVSAINGNGDVVNLFMDYETFGEHQWEDTGIFEFLRALPKELLKHPDNDFVTPSEAAERYKAVSELDVPYFISWADVERDLSAWLSNDMQHEAAKRIYDLEAEVLRSRNKKIVQDWRRLQASDHFYYMCTKWFADGDVHKYFNPYDTPYDAFISYMNALADLELRLCQDH
jgi:alpha-amylase